MSEKSNPTPASDTEAQDGTPKYTAPGIGAGTLIETDDGLVPIDWLVAGDQVMTRDHGFQPLLWIGRQEETQPCVQIGEHAIGFEQPNDVTTLSLDNHIMLSGPQVELHFAVPEAFATAGQLAHWRGLGPAGAAEDGPFYSLLFAQQELIQANGMWLGTMVSGFVADSGFSPRSAGNLRRLQASLDPNPVTARMCLSYRETFILHSPNRRRKKRAA